MNIRLLLLLGIYARMLLSVPVEAMEMLYDENNNNIKEDELSHCPQYDSMDDDVEDILMSAERFINLIMQVGKRNYSASDWRFRIVQLQELKQKLPFSAQDDSQEFDPVASMIAMIDLTISHCNDEITKVENAPNSPRWVFDDLDLSD